MKNIFSALDGGHLDCALFSAQVVGQKDEGTHEHEQTPLHSWLRLGKRAQGRAGTGENHARTTYPDVSL